MNLRAIAASVAQALRPWVATDQEATEAANNFCQIMTHPEAEALEAAREVLSLRIHHGWIQCGDGEAAAQCMARRYGHETSKGAAA